MEKKAQISEDLKILEQEEAKNLGIQDFFNSRDKKNRGTGGLIENAKSTIDSEFQKKEELYEKSYQVNKIPEYVTPMFGGVFLTARRNKVSENGIYLPTASYGKGSETDLDVDFSNKQIVLACGQHATQVAPGMEVVINMDNFKKRLESSLAQKLNKEYEYALPIEIIDGTEYLYVTERDIKYISNNQITQ